MEWKTTTQLLPYPEALATMAARVTAIQKGEAEELAWMVEHPPLYTAGTSAKAVDLLQPANTGDTINYCVPGVLPGAFPVYTSGRGGQYTYHGPGQRVVYIMRDLRKHAGEKGPDLRAYVQQLEQWIILTLQHFGIEGFTREGRVGVWVDQSPVASRQSPVINEDDARAVAPSPLAGEGWDGGAISGAPFSPPLTQPSPARGEGFSSASLSATGHPSPVTRHSEAKIAALGVRVQKWVTSHGIALNVNPDLSHYAGIVPCGLREFGVTSMHQLGLEVSMEEVDAVLKKNFTRVFGAQD